MYDITRELFSAAVYPGDPSPARKALSSIAAGGDYNISAFSACCHNGTHIDAPRHVFASGADAAALPLEAMVGPCTVVSVAGAVTGQAVRALLPRCRRRLLLQAAGRPVLTEEGAAALAAGGVMLLGTDGVALTSSEEAELSVHRCLLGAGIPILEGLALEGIEPGDYFLAALPLKLAGMDAAPVRAVLFAEK